MVVIENDQEMLITSTGSVTEGVFHKTTIVGTGSVTEGVFHKTTIVGTGSVTEGVFHKTTIGLEESQKQIWPK